MRVFNTVARGTHVPRAIVFLAIWCHLVACAGEDATSVVPVTYVAQLRGVNEVPAFGTQATGTATITVTGSVASYAVIASSFASTLTVAHMQIGGPGVVGPVIVPFTILAQSGAVASGSVDLSRPVIYNTLTISGDSLRTLFDAGQVYVNLHTAAAPGGEIRGQIVRQ